MKKYVPLSLLALSSLLVTGCSQSKLKAKYGEMVQEGKNKVAEVTNVKYHNKLSVSSYNYKEGEFYAYKMFALALIIPISEQDYTWKEEGKYWHYHYNSIGDNKSLSELTEEQFNAKMLAHKAKIVEDLLNPLSKAEQLMNEGQTQYKSVKNEYKRKLFKNQYVLNSTAVEEIVASHDEYHEATGTYTTVVDSTEEKTTKFGITLNKNSLPVSFATKTDSETKWTYSYGDAEFTVPDNVREMMNNQTGE